MCNHGWVFAKTCTVIIVVLVTWWYLSFFSCEMVPFVEWLCNGFPCFKPWKVWQQLIKTRVVSGFALCSSASFCILKSNSEAKRSWHWKNRRHLSENRVPEDKCTIFSSFFHPPDSIHHAFIMFSHRWPPIGQLPCHHFWPWRLRPLNFRSRDRRDRKRRRRKDPKAVQKGDHRPRARAKAAWIGLGCGEWTNSATVVKFWLYP